MLVAWKADGNARSKRSYDLMKTWKQTYVFSAKVRASAFLLAGRDIFDITLLYMSLITFRAHFSRCQVLRRHHNIRFRS